MAFSLLNAYSISDMRHVEKLPPNVLSTSVSFLRQRNFLPILDLTLLSLTQPCRDIRKPKFSHSKSISHRVDPAPGPPPARRRDRAHPPPAGAEVQRGQDDLPQVLRQAPPQGHQLQEEELRAHLKHQAQEEAQVDRFGKRRVVASSKKRFDKKKGEERNFLRSENMTRIFFHQETFSFCVLW